MRRVLLAVRLVVAWLAQRWDRLDGPVYAVFASAATAYVAGLFYASMLAQTGGDWSAPLDDVFIHFDYARATARGYPFEWSEGNGFSSGNTSWSYPFILAFGYWIGFRGLSLMLWAAIVAWASVLLFLLAAARAAEPLGRWAKYAIPPTVLSLGALDWSLFSGMENAFHLGMWALPMFAACRVYRESLTVPFDRETLRRGTWLLSLLCVPLIYTRPESSVCAASFGFFAAWAVGRRRGFRQAVLTLAVVGVPAALALASQAVAYRVFTGEWSASGAIAKLITSHPYWTAEQKWDEYVFLLKYVVLRNTQYHFSDALPWGWLVVIVAVAPLAVPKLRPFAILLWTQVIGWLAMVALNLQVRWQNERYTMAAVAWLMVLAAMGIASLLSELGQTRRARIVWGVRAAAAFVIAAVYWQHQAPKLHDQIWFFGRASRNIRDQHVVAGAILAELDPKPNRVLVGDAGALMYASDLPGLDIIGLGGYRDYPFARATRLGLGASIELIEHMPARDRPEIMAIYPTWWGDLPTHFGERITGVYVTGNVICGGAEKVIYRANWTPLDERGEPRSLARDEMVVDELDTADLLSERARDYRITSNGYVDWRVLPDPRRPKLGLFDAGRIVAGGYEESMQLRLPDGSGRLIARSAPLEQRRIEVLVDGESIGTLVFEPADGWAETSIPIEGKGQAATVTLRPEGGDWKNFHVWTVAKDPSPEGAEQSDLRDP